MTVTEILRELADRGVLVAPEGAYLRLFPGSALTPELLASIREHKHELLAALRGPSQHPPALPARAEWCILTALSRRSPTSHAALARATRLPHALLDHALTMLLRRGEVTLHRDGTLRLNAF